MTAQRAQPFINSPGPTESKTHLERLVWAAVGRLSNGDSAGASELLERATGSFVSLDPQPQSIHYLALLTRSRVLEENDQAKITAALDNGRDIARRVRAQGWGTGDVDYALAALEAAGGVLPDALEHLRDAVKLGWRSFLFANQDPAMASLHAITEYQALMQQVEKL